MTTAIETKTTVDAIVSETNANEKNEMVQYDVISYLSCKCGYKAVVPAGNRFNRKCPRITSYNVCYTKLLRSRAPARALAARNGKGR